MHDHDRDDALAEVGQQVRTAQVHVLRATRCLVGRQHQAPGRRKPELTRNERGRRCCNTRRPEYQKMEVPQIVDATALCVKAPPLAGGG
jgi:hypothetical protein